MIYRLLCYTSKKIASFLNQLATNKAVKASYKSTYNSDLLRFKKISS